MNPEPALLCIGRCVFLESSTREGRESNTVTTSSHAVVPACAKGTVAHSCDAKKDDVLVHAE